MEEFELISRYLMPLATAPEALELADDVAIIPGADADQGITKDAIVEGVHFLPETNPALVAKKLLRTNLSDMAAMGATPKFYLVAAFLPRSMDEAWIRAFTEALQWEQEAFEVQLIGGDTVHHDGVLALSLTMLGKVPCGHALRRSGAHPGDMVYVSGTIGDAALGLQLIQNGATGDEAAYLIGRYHIPQPRLVLGQALHGIATSCMDISDGLLGDMEHICKTSRVGVTLHKEKIPLSEAAQQILAQDPEKFGQVATGGDDYELLFTAPEAQKEVIAALAKEHDLLITTIGTVNEGKAVLLLDEANKEISFHSTGFVHE